jgi:5'-nucleotidase
MRTTIILLLTAGLTMLAGCGRPTDKADASANADSNEYSVDSIGTIDPDDTDTGTPADPGDHVAVPPSDPGDDGTNITDGTDGMSEDPAPAPPQTTVHTASKGDTFWSLAVKYYGDGKQWKRIAEANPDVKMNSIPVGAKIVIPRD